MTQQGTVTDVQCWLMSMKMFTYVLGYSATLTCHFPTRVWLCVLWIQLVTSHPLASPASSSSSSAAAERWLSPCNDRSSNQQHVTKQHTQSLLDSARHSTPGTSQQQQQQQLMTSQQSTQQLINKVVTDLSETEFLASYIVDEVGGHVIINKSRDKKQRSAMFYSVMTTKILG